MGHTRARSALIAICFVCLLVLPLTLAAWFHLPSAVGEFIFVTAVNVIIAALVMPTRRQAVAFAVVMTLARAGDALWRAFVADDWRAVLVSTFVAGLAGFALRRQLQGRTVAPSAEA